MLLKDLQPTDQETIYEKDGLIITTTKDSSLAMLENAGFVSLDIPKLIGSTIVDINYENIWFKRDTGYELDCSNIVITLLLEDNSYRRWLIQRDEENNGGGYIGEFEMNGSMITNNKEGERYKKLRA
tara:strand:- start:325 stop:705 length:381 start_codon:yes stop_codon:yes gene_type:complete